MEENPCADLSPWQFGFREGKSTHDAINHVKVVAGAAMSEGGFTVGVSIDICNAFNSVPWSTIRQALINKRFPDYLTRIIDNYLYNRSIEYKLSSEKEPFTCQVTAGVPQVARVLNRIRRLGLQVSLEKTEAIVFYGKNKPPRIVRLNVDGKDIEAKPTLKYLGIMLDGRLNFRPHFEYVENKIAKVNRALGRLMPNLRGPNESKRKLYAQVVLSILLYGAPIWNEAFMASKSSQIIINRVLRTLAIRVVSGYRTISLDAALLLARIPPVYLLANARRRVYDRVKDLWNSNRWSKKAESEIKVDENLLLHRQWEVYCENPNLAGALGIPPDCWSGGESHTRPGAGPRVRCVNAFSHPVERKKKKKKKKKG
ncbi:hypothetical protein ACFW04_012695 [Cataglyphis niger]